MDLPHDRCTENETRPEGSQAGKSMQHYYAVSYSGFNLLQMITLQKGRKYETEGHKLQINWVSGFSGMGIVEWWNSDK